MIKEEVYRYILEQYGVEPEYPWASTPGAAVFRSPTNGKWFALNMQVRKSLLGLDGDDEVEILNVKSDPILISSIVHDTGYLPAYHMNKTHWLTILLDGTLPMAQITPLIDRSAELIHNAKGTAAV